MSDFGNNQQGGNVQGGQQGGEKADWLDKGIEAAGDKAGVNIVRVSSDRAVLAWIGKDDDRVGRGTAGGSL